MAAAILPHVCGVPKSKLQVLNSIVPRYQRPAWVEAGDQFQTDERAEGLLQNAPDLLRALQKPCKAGRPLEFQVPLLRPPMGSHRVGRAVQDESTGGDRGIPCCSGVLCVPSICFAAVHLRAPRQGISLGGVSAQRGRSAQ